MSPPGKGCFLGLLNAIVIAIGFGVTGFGRFDHEDGVGIGIGVFVFGVLPAVIAGGALGRVAERVRTYRFAKLAVPACMVVISLGMLTRVPQHLIVFSCVPTLAAASILERWTRSQPSLAPATARLAHSSSLGIVFGIVGTVFS